MSETTVEILTGRIDALEGDVATLRAENDGIRRHGARVLERCMEMYAEDPGNGHIMIQLRELHGLLLAHPRVKAAEQEDPDGP